MVKGILGVVAGLIAWVIIATVAGVIMRVSWPAYASVATAMTFSLAMMIARLAIGAVATIAAGYVAAVISRSALARLLAGVVLLVLFVPQHVMLWQKFPIWYHLTFLASLVPLTYMGGTLAERRAGRPAGA